MVKITDIRIKIKPDHHGIYATATIVLDHALCIRGLRIVKGRKGAFIGMPSYRKSSGKLFDYCFPINQATRNYLTEEIIKAFTNQFPDISPDLKVYSTQSVTLSNSD